MKTLKNADINFKIIGIHNSENCYPSFLNFCYLQSVPLYYSFSNDVASLKLNVTQSKVINTVIFSCTLSMFYISLH